MHFAKGNFMNSFSDIVPDKSCAAWKDGMVGGNGEIGFVTSGAPYNDVFILQHMYFNYPSPAPRKIPEWLTGQLEEARENVFELNDKWKIWDYDAEGNKVMRNRTYYYSYHPGTQLRLSMKEDEYRDYMRFTNHETGEVGLTYTDSQGIWTRTSFTSRADDVMITAVRQSSDGATINLTLSIDDVADMCNATAGPSDVTAMRYKKLADAEGRYLSFIAHYPVYEGSELYDGGYASVTRIIVEGSDAICERVLNENTNADMNVGENASVRIHNATAVYLITAIDRSFRITGLGADRSADDIMQYFAGMETYELLGTLRAMTDRAAERYTGAEDFDYAAALAPSAELHGAEFNRVSFALSGDEEDGKKDNEALILQQRTSTERINHEFMRRVYHQSRYAQICCGGVTAPRLYGMWTGDWQPGWRAIYTLDANVNLQVSAMNTGHLQDMPMGYITFFLRHTPDFMENARRAYGMHDAIQISVNADADRAMHVEYDWLFPFEYWNAGASWCLLPIYEYWQCYGNRQIPINDYMRIDNLQHVLSVEDGGLSEEAFAKLKEQGSLDLERDILLPLLTKQANFWEQLVTPRYYTDVDGKACHDENKTALQEGEKYILIPTYSPENSPVGYCSTLTANATMDIAAARDGLDMLCMIENTVKRDGYEEAVARWTKLKNQISGYRMDKDGALREWAMEEYTENNNHRHLSHLYVAWPAYETQNNPELAKAANIALSNRNEFNTDDATAGHGWIHKALVEARLKRGDGMVSSLLKMMNGIAYYPSLMTDHDSNRRWGVYCTDTLFGTVGAVNEALVYSNTGEIEILPALPTDWKAGKVSGLMSRSRAEITELVWDCEKHMAKLVLTSNREENRMKLGCKKQWTKAVVAGREVYPGEDGYIRLNIGKDEKITIEFVLA